MVSSSLRRRVLAESRDVSIQRADREYADRPPPTPSPTSSEFQEYQQAISNGPSSPNSRELYNPIPYNLTYLSSIISSTGETVPTYDETINRDLNRPSTTSLAESPIHIPRPSPSPQHNINSNSDNNNDSNGNEAQSLKVLGLNFLNARQHLALASCRDLVLFPPLYHGLICFKKAFDHHIPLQPLTVADQIQQIIMPASSEHFIAGIWCLVAAYLSFSVVDGLMVRWIVTYQTTAAIVRVLSMTLLLITMEQAALAILSPDGLYSLHTWILISCILTGAYILQNFVTSNLDLKNDRKPRRVDYYNIMVYAVVPVGLASFVSMIGLLRELLILRLDIDRREDNLLTELLNLPERAF